MTQRKKMKTPSKKPESSSMTHEEEEEMQHDTSNLRDQVQQIFLTQKVTKNEVEAKMDGLKNGLKPDMEGLKDVLKADMEGLKDVLKADMEGLKDGLKADMEAKMKGLKEVLRKLLQENFPNGEKVFDETHDENKRNVNHDFKDYKFGIKIHHIPNIDIRKFNGKDPITWILHME